MPDSITIPRSINAAERKLNELGEIATATEWHRAAIVATYVSPEGHGGDRRSSSRSNSNPDAVNASTFAAKGIVGLRSTSTVLIYARAWSERFDVPVPGRRVTLPYWCGQCNADDAHEGCHPWPPTRTGTNGHNSEEGARATFERIVEQHGPEAVAGMVEASPPVRLAVSRARLNQATTPQQRRDLRERNRQRRERMESASDEMFTRVESTGLVDHESTLMARTARSWMRKAVAEYERNPLMTEEQRADHEMTLAEIDHLSMLLHGDTREWTEADRDFLRALGIEEEEVSS